MVPPLPLFVKWCVHVIQFKRFHPEKQGALLVIMAWYLLFPGLYLLSLFYRRLN
jgi:hypothetical protein